MLHHAGTVPSSSSRKSRAESVDTGDNSDEESDYQDSNQDGDGHADSSRKNANGGEGHVVKAKNREHAKNTRMRKKNYIETLKEDISHLSSTRDLRERNRKIMLSKLAEQVQLLTSFIGLFYFAKVYPATSNFILSKLCPMFKSIDRDSQKGFVYLLPLPHLVGDESGPVGEHSGGRFRMCDANHSVPILPASSSAR